MTIVTRVQAEALHRAIEERDDAWNRFHSAALMPARQMSDDRLAAAANRWVAAERAVEELSHGVALVQTDGLPEPGAETEGGGSTASASVKAPAKKRGRPPKAKAAQSAAGSGRTEEQVRAEAAAASGAQGPQEAGDGDAGGDGAAA